MFPQVASNVIYVAPWASAYEESPVRRPGSLLTLKPHKSRYVKVGMTGSTKRQRERVLESCPNKR